MKKKFNTKVVPIYIERLNNNKFKITVHDIIEFDNVHDIETITFKLNKILERENRIDLYKDCLKFLQTRVNLDLALFKDDIWSH